MSSINYNVWGNPGTWTHWSASTNPTTETLYGSYRNGASDWDNTDFNDYPYFKISNIVNLRNLVVNNNIALNEPLDNSLSYTAINNPNLPQYNRYVFNSIHHTVNDYIAKSNDNPLPFSLAYYYRNDNSINTPCQLGTFYGFDGFPNNAAILDLGKMQRYSPFAEYDTTYTNVSGDYNPILRIAPILSFGTKSVILEIVVGYIDNATTMATSNLKSYLNHNDDWLQNHPIVMAYCMPHFRNDVNGTYNTNISNPSMRFTGVCPIFYNPFRDKSNTYDIYNYLSTFNYSGGSGCFPIFGGVYRDSFATSVAISVSRVQDDQMSKTNLSRYAIIYGADKGTIHYTGDESSGYIYCTLDMSVAENVEYIMKGAAAYGLFFCTDIGTLGQSGRDTGVNERWADSDMYLGIIRSDGMTYGDYTHGTANKDQLQYEWKDSTQTPFVPSQSINDYSQQTRIRSIGHIDTMTDRYVLNSTAVNALSVDLFGIMSDLSEQSTNWADLFAKTIDNFLVQNPIDCIISLKKYPVKEIPNTGTLTNIHYGRYSTGSAAGYPCTADVYTYAFQPKHIQPRFENSFLDYEPYTSAEIYIPYCGSVSLKMCDILGKQLQPFLCVDYHTGQCTGFVMCDGIVIETIQGTIAVDVPVTGIQTATVESQLMNAANSARQIRVNQMAGYAKSALVVGAATVANPVAGAVALASQIKNTVNNQFQRNIADYNLSHTEAPQHVIGTSSSACGWIIDSDTARLILYYPAGDVITDNNPPEFNTAKLSAFGAKSGFATVETGTLSQYTGFTSGDILTDGINATDTEKDIIKSLFATGIYL